MIRDRLRQRLTNLHAEFEKGQKQLNDIRNQQTHLQETLLRIQGAIQVLEEELEKDVPGNGNGDPLSENVPESAVKAD